MPVTANELRKLRARALTIESTPRVSVGDLLERIEASRLRRAAMTPGELRSCEQMEQAWIASNPAAQALARRIEELLLEVPR